MATVVEVLARFGADTSNFKRGVDGATDSMNRMKKAAEQNGQTTEKAMSGMQTKSMALAVTAGSLLANGLANAGQAALQFGQAVLGQAMNMQQAKIAFTNFLGSAEKADVFLRKIADFAAKTPFEFPELVDASKQMMAFGFATEQIIPMMTAIGDAAAGLGSGSEGIERITRQLGQMKMKGLAAGEEMRVIAEAGVPAWQYLADTLNVDVATAMKMVEKRTVSADVAIASIVKGMENGTKSARGFGGMMDQQSRTLQGVISTFKDSVMNSLVRALDPIVAGLTNIVAAATPAAEALSKGIGGAIEGLVAGVGALGSVIGPVVSFFQAIPTPVYAAVGAMLAFNLAGKAMGVVIPKIATSLLPLARAIDGVRLAWWEAKAAAQGASATMGKELITLKALGSMLGQGVGGAMKGLKSAGTALFSMMGGPWGMAIGAATVGLEMYQNAQANAKAAVDALTGSMNQQTGQMTADSYKLIAQALADDITKADEWARLNKEGLGLDKATAALMSGGKALADFEAHLDRVSAQRGPMGALASALGSSMANQKSVIYDANSEWSRNKAVTEAAAKAQVEATGAVDAAAVAQKALEGATKKAADAAKALENEWKDLQGILDAGAKSDAWKRNLLEMAATFAKVRKDNKGHGQAMSLDFHDAIRGMVDNLTSFTQTLKLDKQGPALLAGLQKIKAVAMKNGMSAADANAFFNPLIAEAKVIGKKAGTAFSTANTKALDKGKVDAFAKAQEMGYQTAYGFAIGIAKRAGLAAAEAASMAHAARIAANKALLTASPSKVFIKIGEWVGAGFVLGMKNSKSKVAAAATEAAQAAVDAFKAKAQEALDFANSIKDSIASAGGVMNASTDEEMSADNVIDSMQRKLAAAKKFYADLAALKKMGLNSTSLQEIIAAGFEQGGAVAAALIEGGKAAVRQVNSLESQLLLTGGDIGSLASKDKYGLTAAQAKAGTSIVVAKGGISITFPSGVTAADKKALEAAVEKAVNAALHKVVKASK